MELPKNEYRISITSGCNMQCVYCHNEGNNHIVNLSKEAIEELVKNSQNLGLKAIRLTGGEPTIHKDFLDICQMLKEKYNLKVGVNTNAIQIDKLLYAIENGWIDRLTVGIDYLNGNISKNSPVGLPSSDILNNILKMKNANAIVSVAKVFNYDNENTISMVDWGIRNGIIVKIIEIVSNEIYPTTSQEFSDIRNRIIEHFDLITSLDKFNQVIGLNKINGEILVKFFHSHCRLRECDICKRMHLRVTADGKLKECLFYDDKDIFYNENNNINGNVLEVLERPVDYHKKRVRM